MYVGYLLDKDSNMYHQGPVRRSSINHHLPPPQNFVSTPQYADFTGYHHVVPSVETTHGGQSAGSWGPSSYPPNPCREEWGAVAYGLGPPPNAVPAGLSTSSPGQVAAYCSPDYGHMHAPTPPAAAAAAALLQPPPPHDSIDVAQLSPERRNSYQWMHKTVQSSSTGELLLF